MRGPANLRSWESGLIGESKSLRGSASISPRVGSPHPRRSGGSPSTPAVAPPLGSRRASRSTYPQGSPPPAARRERAPLLLALPRLLGRATSAVRSTSRAGHFGPSAASPPFSSERSRPSARCCSSRRSRLSPCFGSGHPSRLPGQPRSRRHQAHSDRELGASAHDVAAVDPARQRAEGRQML